MQVSELVVGSGETLEIGAGSNLQAAGVVRVADGGMIRIADNGILSIRNLATPGLELIQQIERALSSQQAIMQIGEAGAMLNAVGEGFRSLSGITRPEQRRRQPEPPAEVQVVRLEEGVLLEEVDRRLRAGVLSDKAMRAMKRFLEAYAGKSKRGPQEPPLKTKIALVEDFERLQASKGITQPAYVAFHAHKIYHRVISLRTFQNYLSDVRIWRELDGSKK